MRAVKIKARKVESLPCKITLPRIFIYKNQIMKGDVIDYYVLETGELLIKKRRENES